MKNGPKGDLKFLKDIFALKALKRDRQNLMDGGTFQQHFLKTVLRWYDNSSESADFKERFGDH